MNYKTSTISAFCIFSLAFVIACGAQNDSLSTNEALIEELIADPLTEQFKKVGQMQRDLILYNNLNLDALREVLENTPEKKACNVTADLSHILHAVEYFDNMCQYVTLNRTLRAKYPFIKDFDMETRIDIFHSHDPLTREEILLIQDAWGQID